MDKQVLQEENKRLKQENDELKKQIAEINKKESSTTYRNWYNTLRTISDNIPDMIWAKDLEKKYILVNKAICENLLNAKDTSEPIGKNDLFFAERERNSHPENPEWHTFGEICQDSDSIVMQNRKAEHFDEFGNVKGKFLFLDVHKSPLYDESGRMIGTVGSARDVTAEKETRKKLIESEEKYRTLFERANDAIFLMKDGVFIECNQLTYKMFACEREDIIGKRPSEFSPEHQPEGMLSSELAPRKIEIALKDGSNTFEWKHKRLDGTLFDAEVSLSRLKIGEEDYLQAIVRDISFRKQAEQSLKESEQRYKMLADATREAIFITRKGYCVDANQTASDLFGYTYDEFIGACATLIIAPESGELVKKNIHSGFDRVYEAVGLKKDGTKFPVELRGKSFAYREEEARLTVCRDLTLQKQSEQHIKETTERLKRAEKVAHIGNWEYHLESGELITSEGYHEIYGLPPGQKLTIRQAKEMSLPEYRQKIDEAINRLIKTHEPCTYEYQIRRLNDDSIRYVFSTVRINAEKNVIFGIIQDVTERKKFENALKKAKELAIESDRLKTSFLATISHELRTPLNSIIGYSEIIDETLDKQQIIDFAKTIYKNGNHLLTLIEDMLDISSMESGDIEIEKTHFNLRTFLSKIHQMLKGELQHQKKEHLEITMSYDFKTIDQDIFTDQQRLEKIFQNLINNAIKFTQQGKVEIGFSPPQDNRITFFVKDSGIGIPKEKHEMIFERFRQVEDSNTRKYSGTGLGLYVCKLIVERLDGKIWVTSEPGVGSVFYFSLPCFLHAQSLQVKEKVEPAIAESKELSGTTILVAEDESSNFFLVKSILTRAGAEVFQVENGRELLDYIEHQPAPDAILLDIKMPVMDGETALKKIRSTHENLLVIALTAYAMKGDREKYLRAGCDDYISKPVKKEKLLEVLLKHLKD